MSINTPYHGNNGKINIQGYQGIIGEILHFNIMNGGYDKYQQNRSTKYRNAVMLALIIVNHNTENTNNEFAQKFSYPMQQILTHTTNKQNNIIHLSHVSPEHIIYNKYNQRLLMNYIQHIFKQQNPDKRIIITQTSIQEDLSKGYDFIIQCDDAKYKVDVKTTANQKTVQKPKENIKYIYLTSRESNQVRNSGEGLLNYLTIEQINNIDTLANIFKEYLSSEKIQPENIVQYNINLRKKQGQPEVKKI